MEEIIDLLDEFGNKTNKTISKDIAHEKGLWHGAVHIIFINKDKTKVLLQYRCKEKKLYPNAWDISVGGHISKGELPIEAAERELKEELGLNLKDYKIEEIGIFKETFKQKDIYSNEYVNTYVIYDNVDVNDLQLQKEEVSDVKWFTKNEFNRLFKENNIVPHLNLFNIINKILI